MATQVSLSQRVGQSWVGTYFNTIYDTMKKLTYTGLPLKSMGACAWAIKVIAVGTEGDSGVIGLIKDLYNDPREKTPIWKKCLYIPLAVVVGIILEAIAASFTTLFALITLAELIVPIPLIERGIKYYSKDLKVNKQLDALESGTPHVDTGDLIEEPQPLSFWQPINYKKEHLD